MAFLAMNVILTIFLNQVLQKQCYLCACAVSLGGCFAVSCSGINAGTSYFINEAFPILGVIGEVLSLLSLVSFSPLAIHSCT